ncbi:hypothetical protein [Paraglaciecola sp. L3A3]|uniref:hypothetical protein n=1 Tax=Paraglaciecola sp. L3A3 TaxID=2686358 RepID=UPI00131AD51F|nr:hypothetical protein [Paraglaciecola sp. L3A3]
MIAALNIAGANGNEIEKIEVKHLYFDEATKAPVLEKLELDKSITEYTVDTESTAILKITYANDVVVDQTSQETKYYSDTYRQTITANNDITFNVNGVDNSADFGEAVLRIGLGRAHGKSITPTVKINGHDVTVIEDIRGYDQNTRPEFFGVVEVAIPYALLEVNNKVDLSFSDTGGVVSSVTMQVFNMSASPGRTH